MTRRLGPRFGLEAGFLIGVAVVLGLLEVSWPAIVAAMAIAWLLVAAVEILLARRPAAPEAGPVPAAATEPAQAAVQPLPQLPPPVLEEPPPVSPDPVTPVREPPASPEPPREWNLWELERIAREHAGADPARDDERSFLLLSLRDHARPDGNLPAEFDPLVRDAFGDVLRAPA